MRPAVGDNTLTLLHSTQTFPGQTPPIESVLTSLINDLAGIPGDFIVALDDYHLIESQQVHDGITYLLEHMPAHMHLAITTRADPPLPLARLRVRGTMLEIGVDDLRFNPDEVTMLLAEMKIQELSREDVFALNERTEGWVAGLKMAALSMSGQKDIAGFITAFTGSQRFVMDYLMEEVLQKQSVEMRDFLLKTSVLKRLSGPLCDAVTGRKGSRDILLNLERGHLFIVPLDEARQWYRYEHLFYELLRHQLESIYGAEVINELHGRASRWYEDNNLPDEAINHALATRDWDRATPLIIEHGKNKRQSGEFVTLLNWTQQLPEEVILSHQRLCIDHIVAMSWAGQLEAAESRLKTFEQAAQGDDSIKGFIATQRAHHAWRRHDYPLAGELAEKALSLLPPDAVVARGAMNNVLGSINNSRGNFKEAEPLFTEAYEAGRQTGEYFLASMAFGGLMMIVRQKGELRRASEMSQQALEWAGPSLAAIELHLGLSSVLYEWNDLESAVNHVQRAIELGQLVGDIQARVRIHLILAHVRLARGEEAEFLKELEKADFEARSIVDRPAIQAEHAVYLVQFALRQDDLAAASAWGNRLAEEAHALPHCFCYVAIRLLIAQGRKSEALEKLQVLYDEAVQSGAQYSMIIYRVYQALAAETEASALEFLADALAMAEPEGYIRTFVDEGKLLAPLLRKALSMGILPDYVGKLLTIIAAEKRHKLVKGESAPSMTRGILSERELEVLRLLAEGLSNQQIAGRLFISLGTVKIHVHNILDKLGTKVRSQAVARAREIRLI